MPIIRLNHRISDKTYPESKENRVCVRGNLRIRTLFAGSGVLIATDIAENVERYQQTLPDIRIVQV